VHPPSIRPFGLTALASSGPVALRHPKQTTYRCFLPDLTGFIALRRVGPGPQRCSAQPVPRYTNLGREFSPAIAACGYRAPLAPRLARPLRSYHAPPARQDSFGPNPKGRIRSREERPLDEASAALGFSSTPRGPLKRRRTFGFPAAGAAAAAPILDLMNISNPFTKNDPFYTLTRPRTASVFAAN